MKVDFFYSQFPHGPGSLLADGAKGRDSHLILRLKMMNRQMHWPQRHSKERMQVVLLMRIELMKRKTDWPRGVSGGEKEEILLARDQGRLKPGPKSKLKLKQKPMSGSMCRNDLLVHDVDDDIGYDEWNGISLGKSIRTQGRKAKWFPNIHPSPSVILPEGRTKGHRKL